MYEVTATYPDGELRTFYDWWNRDPERGAALAHPHQSKAKEVVSAPALVDASWHFYSVSFHYSVPDSARPKAISGPGFHLRFSHDEKEGSKRLSLAMNTLEVAILRARLFGVSQYAYPDGSLHFWFASRLGEQEFLKQEMKRLEEELEYLTLHPFHRDAYYDTGKDGKKRRFRHRYGESRVQVDGVREDKNPLRHYIHSGYLTLVDLFNNRRYPTWYDAKHEKTLVVSEGEAQAFEEGVRVAYGDQNLFSRYIERHSPEEIHAFSAAYGLTRILQILTE